MASNGEVSDENCSNLRLKVKGDLGDIEIIEETYDTDEEDTPNESSRTDSALANIPSNLIQTSNTPTYDSVVVKDSKNVQFGNNTYFNGPITIKQVIRSNPSHDNGAYLKTEDEDLSKNKEQDNRTVKPKPKKFKIRVWHKVACSAFCIAIIGGMCAVVSVFLIDHSTQENLTDNEEQSCQRRRNVSHVVNHVNRRMSENEGSTTDIQECSYADSLLIAPDHLRIVSRSDWLAQPTEGKVDDIRQPVPWVIISHTATESCFYQSECVLRVRLIQMFHIESRKWFDIGYNFLIGGDGSAYYGRGWDQIGAHTLGYNKYSIGISFIGTFNNEPPPQKQLEACQKLLKRGVALKKLDKNYKLFAHRQLASTLSPGDKLYDIIKEWPHFVKNFTDISELIPKY